MLNYKTIADAAELIRYPPRIGLEFRASGIIFICILTEYYAEEDGESLLYYDTGLVAYLTKWTNSETLMNGAMSGAIGILRFECKSYKIAG